MRAADHSVGQTRAAERMWCGRRWSLKEEEKSGGEGRGGQSRQSEHGSWVMNDSGAGSLSAGTMHMSVNLPRCTANVLHVSMQQKQLERKGKWQYRFVVIKMPLNQI